MKTISARNISAHDYHAFMLASETDRGPRAMFQQAVFARARPGSSIFDFGAGTGIDAKVYAERGYRVHAYDASPEMRKFLSHYCRPEIEAGRINLIDLNFAELLDLSGVGEHRVDAITANFAVLNLIPDHMSLFRAFDRWLSPAGFILVGMISPYHLSDMRYSWWWRHLGDLLLSGRYDLRTGEDLTYRFGVSALKRAAAPHFVLEGIVRSAPARSPFKQHSDSANSTTDWCGPLFLCTHHFMFLLFRRR